MSEMGATLNEVLFVTVHGPGYALLYDVGSCGMEEALMPQIERMVARPRLQSVRAMRALRASRVRLSMLEVKDDDEGITWDWRAMQAAKP